MELTILGRYSPYPANGGAMSGYLVSHGGTTLLLDAGNGVAARLQQHVKIEELTALVVSHLHEDHIADAHCLRFMQMDALMAKRTPAKLQVYAPTEPAVTHSWLEDGEDWQELRTYDPTGPLVIGALEITFTRTNHPIPCYAMRIKPVGAEGPVLFYTADTGESAAVAEAARGADLLLVEASLTEEYLPKRIFGHLTGAEAAAMGREAGAKRVLLTHLYPGVELAQLLGEARQVLASAELAEEGRTYLVGD